MEDTISTMDGRVAEAFSFHGNGMVVRDMVLRLRTVHGMKDQEIDQVLNQERRQGRMELVGLRLYVT